MKIWEIKTPDGGLYYPASLGEPEVNLPTHENPYWKIIQVDGTVIYIPAYGSTFTYDCKEIIEC